MFRTYTDALRFHRTCYSTISRVTCPLSGVSVSATSYCEQCWWWDLLLGGIVKCCCDRSCSNNNKNINIYIITSPPPILLLIYHYLLLYFLPLLPYSYYNTLLLPRVLTACVTFVVLTHRTNSRTPPQFPTLNKHLLTKERPSKRDRTRTSAQTDSMKQTTKWHGHCPKVVPVETRVKPNPQTSENSIGRSYGEVLRSKDVNSSNDSIPSTNKPVARRSLADLEHNWRVKKHFSVQSRDATPAQSKAKGSRGKYIPPFQRNRGESKSNSPSEKLKRLRYNPEPKRSKLYKTQLCETYKEFGECKYGSNCQYAHGKEELREKPAPYRPSAYKTVRCKNYWSKDSICPYGSKCRFIHEEATGIDERKVEKMKNHSKYKTQECKTYQELGTCPYGDKCAFIHKPKVVQCIECTDAPINFLTKTTGRIT